MNLTRTTLTRLRATTARSSAGLLLRASYCRQLSVIDGTTPTGNVRRLSSTTVATTSQDDWREYFSVNGKPPAVLYDNPWDSASARLKPFTDPVADTVSRHIIQLLQELYLTGRPRSDDRITTERCNTVLRRLVSVSGGSDRAHAILENMQLFRQHTSSSSSRRHAMDVPAADRDTYRYVLQAESRGGDPHRTKTLVEDMERRYREEGDLALKPHGFHWNCVLLAWKESPDWEKAVHAAKILFDLHEQHDPDSLNVTCYITLLRICAHQHANDKAALLGANVAIKMWHLVIESSTNKDEIPDFPSHFYSIFLQAIRPLPKENDFRWRYFGKCFGRACQTGKVNEVVLNEFLVHCRSKRVSDMYLGEYMERIRDLSPREAVQVLMECVPSAWTERADPIREKE